MGGWQTEKNGNHALQISRAGKMRQWSCNGPTGLRGRDSRLVRIPGAATAKDAFSSAMILINRLAQGS